MRNLAKSDNWHNWIYFGLRWLFLLGFGLVLFVVRDFNTGALNEVFIPVAVGAVATLVLGAMIAIPNLSRYVPFVLIPGDWIIVGVFVYFSGGNPALVLGISGIVIFSGFFRLGASMEGFIHAIGSMVAAGVGLIVLLGAGYFTQDSANIQNYLPAAILLITLILGAGIWSHMSAERFRVDHDRIMKESSTKQRDLESMRERAKAISELATTLNATLRYEAVLDAALNIGRVALHKNSKQRVISIVLLYTPNENLEIASSRGLPYQDEHRVIPSNQGLVGAALSRAMPVIGGAAKSDPVLRVFVAFQNTKSMLCIPLRAGMDNYGVLLFGSGASNAFNASNIDTLKIVGTQITIALQNSVLYSNLMEEKERIIAIQDNARDEIARDLHDIPTQTISAVAMRLAIIPKMLKRDSIERVISDIDEIRELALRATEEIRQVLFNLRPLVIESRGLQAALDQLAEKMHQASKQKMSAYVERGIEQLLDANQQRTIFGVIEEAANNARKHANAPLIQAQVTREGDMIVVRIQDNGQGFDVKKVNADYASRGSFGMVNMQDRAALLDGIIDIQSQPGQGTTVTVNIPIPAQHPHLRSEDTGSSIPKTKLALNAMEHTDKYYSPH